MHHQDPEVCHAALTLARPVHVTFHVDHDPSDLSIKPLCDEGFEWGKQWGVDITWVSG